MKNDGLIVIGRLGYPSARAASNRVHLYCKALKEVKGFPLVINLHSVFTKRQTFNYLGRNDGIPFYFDDGPTPFLLQIFEILITIIGSITDERFDLYIMVIIQHAFHQILYNLLSCTFSSVTSSARICLVLISTTTCIFR